MVEYEPFRVRDSGSCRDGLTDSECIAKLSTDKDVKMKKPALLLAALLTIALGACGKKEEPAPAPAPAPAPVAQPAAPAPQPVIEQAEEKAEEAVAAAADTAEAAAEATDEAATSAAEQLEAAKDAVVEAGEEAKEAVASAVAAAATAAGVGAVAPLSAVEAENLAKAKNCMACHAIERKLVGPSYQEVAQKRAGEEGALAMLTEKIQKGGSGVYGPVPMPPNPQVTADEANQLAQWVLGLK